MLAIFAASRSGFQRFPPPISGLPEALKTRRFSPTRNSSTGLIFGFDNPQQRMLWLSQITLSARYFESLQKHAVPFDHRAVAALANSAMPRDVYSLLAQRLRRIAETKPQFIAWCKASPQPATHQKAPTLVTKQF